MKSSAREIQNGAIIFCGTGISMLAAMAANNISVPNCVIFFETGAAVNGGLADAFGPCRTVLPANAWSEF